MLWWVFGALAGAGVLWRLLPREPVRTDVSFDINRLHGGVEAYLVQAEAGVPQLRAGAAKRVIWAGAPEQRAPWAVVYVHGFSASLEEIRPVPDNVAKALGANLFLTRLSGHGRDGPAMAEARLEHWMRDMAEALAIGARIGERVLVISTSTGGTLTALALHEAMGSVITGAVFVSPNFRVNNPRSGLLSLRGARLWLPLLARKPWGFEPRAADHGVYWTPRYPAVATLPMAAAVTEVHKRRHEAVAAPALFVFDPADEVVDHAATRAVIARWGGVAETMEVDVGAGDDPSRHLIAGDIMSPGMTSEVSARIMTWARGLVT